MSRIHLQLAICPSAHRDTVGENDSGNRTAEPHNNCHCATKAALILVLLLTSSIALALV